MVERNLIREGFIRNTSADLLTFSGSQLLNEQQQTALADGNTSVAAVTVSATENINVTADLGARWKINRIELYTDDPSTSNITMEISDNDIEYYPVTLTGSPNLYVGDISDSTVSGAPRYIRYDHAAASSLDVFEWRAMSDDTLVDFGTAGDDTEVEIADAPIGRPSDNVTALQLFNKFNKPGTAFAFIDNTGTEADALFEMATQGSGPWFGRGVQDSIQPTNTPLASGIFDGTRVVTASGYFFSWKDTNRFGGWTHDNGGFVTLSPDVGMTLEATATTQPRTANFGLYTGITNDDVGGNDAEGGIGRWNIHRDAFVFRPEFYDTIRVRMKGPQIDPSEIVEGPRIYWRAADGPDDTSWPIAYSTTAVAAGLGFPDKFVDYTFDVGAVPTWSGSGLIRGLSLQPYTTNTGIDGLQTDIEEIEVYNRSVNGGDMIVLQDSPTLSGLRPHLVDASVTGEFFERAVLAMGTRIMEPCIITKVTWVSTNPNASNVSGLFLARFNEGEPNYSFPVRDTNNFTVKNVTRVRVDNGRSSSTFTHFLLWRAEPGDFIGWSRENFGIGLTYRNTSAAGYASAWLSPNLGVVSLNSAQDCEDDLNNTTTDATDTTWVRVDNAELQVWAETVSMGDFLPTGTYETPVFDAGTLPGLISSSFSSIEEGGSSIDSLVTSAFKTVEVRASDSPPKASISLGFPTSKLDESVRYASRTDTDIPGYLDPTYAFIRGWSRNDRTGPDPIIPKLLNEEFGTAAPNGSSWTLNHSNPVVANLYGQTTNAYQNVGAAMMYHERDDELWVLNVLISGTSTFDTNDQRPIWDVYDPVDFSYIRTEHVKGQINYAYLSADINRETAFEPGGFIYDGDQEEIYIINRENYFYIGTATYYAVVTDLDGNFKRLSFRLDTMGAPNNNWWTNVVCTTFDGTYFYFLTDDTGNATPSQGSHLMVAKRGDDTTNDSTAVNVIATQAIDSIVGFETVANNPDGQAITIGPDGLLYILYADPINSSDNGAFRDHELHAIRPNFASDGLSIDSWQKVPLNDPSGISTTGGVRVRALDVRRDGFYGDGNTFGDSDVLYSRRYIQHDPGMIYDPIRDQFTVLQLRTAKMGDEYHVPTNNRLGNTNIYNEKGLSFMLSFAADFETKIFDGPTRPQYDDPIWGAASGTLVWDTKQPDSILFPTGRYGQVRYRLNAGTGSSVSPILTGSQLDQGIRVGDIPASGTVPLYLRTNIPEGQPLGDLQGRLKVFWELPE